jgi:large subunit ribosomal protein L10
MVLARKEQFVTEMRDSMERSVSALFVDYSKMTVAEADRLRIQVRAGSMQYRVVKNTLMTRVLNGTPYADAQRYLKGTPTGVLLSFEDPTAVARLAVSFAKECDKLKIKGGVLDSRPITPQEAVALSQMPSRADLQAQIVGLAMSPGRQLMRQIKHPAGRIVGALEARIAQLEQAVE